MTASGRDWGAVAGVFLAALAWHVAMAASVSGPTQWDSAYTWEVARNLASGRGAVSDALWTMAWLPPDLTHPADLHWSPLPSRVLVPAMWVSSSWRAAQAVSVFIAACWAPLGWMWGRHLGLRPGLAVVAGLVAGSGLGALPFLGVPDSVGLFGLVAAAALLSAARGKTLQVVLLCALAALTRGDGFLLGLACAISLPGRKGLWAAFAGLGATALWGLRNYLLVGEGFMDLRGRVSSARAVGDLLLLHDPPAIGLGGRLGEGAVGIATSLGLTVLQMGVVPLIFALLAMLFRRRDRSLWALLAFAVLVIGADNLLAPGVASKGTVYRSMAGLIPVVAALSMVGASDVLRGLPRWALPGIVAVGGVLISASVARSMAAAFVVYDDCEVLEAAGVPTGAAVLAYEPLHLTARCGHPAVQIPPDATAEELGTLAARYHIDWAVVAPASHAQPAWREGTVRIVGFGAAGERVLRRP